MEQAAYIDGLFAHLIAALVAEPDQDAVTYVRRGLAAWQQTNACAENPQPEKEPTRG